MSYSIDKLLTWISDSDFAHFLNEHTKIGVAAIAMTILFGLTAYQYAQDFLDNKRISDLFKGLACAFIAGLMYPLMTIVSQDDFDNERYVSQKETIEQLISISDNEEFILSELQSPPISCAIIQKMRGNIFNQTINSKYLSCDVMVDQFEVTNITLNRGNCPLDSESKNKLFNLPEEIWANVFNYYRYPKIDYNDFNIWT